MKDDGLKLFPKSVLVIPTKFSFSDQLTFQISRSCNKVPKVHCVYAAEG